MKSTLFITFLFSFLFLSCSKDSEQKMPDKSINSEENITIDNLTILPMNFQPKYKIQKEEDLSYRDNKKGQLIKRIQIRITVPAGLNKSDLENNLKHATKSIYNKHIPNGISIFAYEEGDNVMSTYTVAKCDFAPFGDWEKITSSSKLDDYKLQIDIREAYFKPKTLTLKKGSVVKLFREEKWDRKKRDFVPAKDVALSKSINSWVEEDIIAYAMNNSSAKILDVYKEKFSDGSDFIRYKVLVTINGKDFEGWVHGEEVRK